MTTAPSSYPEEGPPPLSPEQAQAILGILADEYDRNPEFRAALERQREQVA